MKVLVMYDYPPSPGGLATQGDLLYRGLRELGVNVHAVHFESSQEKEWYYRWFRPDIAVGVGYWGHTPELILHPKSFGILPIPWLVADGYIANYQSVLNDLPLLLVTSHWVKDMYVRDGIKEDQIKVLPVGCDTSTFVSFSKNNPKIRAVRDALGISPEELMVLTVGGDAASKGAREVMQALSLISDKVPPWKYVCKVWPQPRTKKQNLLDLELAHELGLKNNIIYATNKVSRNFMPYLIGACDIYAAPSRLEGFGMPQVEAGACSKPVIGIKAMGMLDTLVHEKTGLLARVEEEIVVNEVMLGKESGFGKKRIVEFERPRTVDYRANIEDIADYLQVLMTNASLRKDLGHNARTHVVANFDYRLVAQKFLKIIQDNLHIN